MLTEWTNYMSETVEAMKETKFCSYLYLHYFTLYFFRRKSDIMHLVRSFLRDTFVLRACVYHDTFLVQTFN